MKKRKNTQGIEGSNADILAATLNDLGIHVVFGMSGGRILPLFQAIARYPNVDLIAVRNEQGAGYMADGYARVNNCCTCCISTSGPGATNLLTGIAGAYADSVPIIVITGQATTSEIGHGGIQEGSGFIRSPDIAGMYRNACKWTYRLGMDDNVMDVLKKAHQIAISGRPGPVHLDIPTDVLEAPVQFHGADLQSNQYSLKEDDFVKSSTPASNDMVEVINLLKNASDPLIVAGRGVYMAKAMKLLRRVQRQLAIPVCTSLGGRGVLDEYDPLSLGQIGCYGQDAANHYLMEEADVILTVGMSFQYLTTMGWNSAWDNRKLIQVDIDKRELGKNFHPDIRIHSSLEIILEQLLTECPNPSTDIRFSRIAKLNQIRHTYGYFPSHRVYEAGIGRQGFVNPAFVFQCLASHLEENDIVVLDSGENAYWGMFSLPVKYPNQLIANGGWGSMGYGVAATVGIAVGQKEVNGRVYGICGDGGLMMNVQEISTAVQYELPCTWLVMNNECYGTQKHWQRDLYEGQYIGTDMPPIDYTRLTTAMGASALTVESEKELEAALYKATQSEEPFLIDIKIDPEVKPSQALGSLLVK